MSNIKTNTFFLIALILFSNISSLALTTKTNSNLKLKTSATCNSDKGFGIDLKCYATLDYLKLIPFPDDVQKILNETIFQIINRVSTAEMCIGDTSGDYITGSKMSQFTCDTIPLDPQYKYGVFSTTLRNVPCGKPVEVSICAAFDRCGTVAVSINGGVLACAAAYTTGIGSALSTVAESLDYLNFAISIPKRLIQTFKIARAVGNSIETKTITTRGHISLGVGLAFPLDFIKIKGKPLGEYISLNAKIAFLLDLGNVSSFVTETINNFKNMDKSVAKKQLNTLMNSGAEFTATLQGVLTLNLKTLTSNLLDDLEINIARTSLLVTTGTGESGMAAGLYIYFTADALKNLLTLVDKVLQHFDGILNAIGFKRPNIPSTDVTLGIFLQTDSVGFTFKFPLFEFKCIFKFESQQGSCQFDNKFFTAMIKQAKWVIKKAGKFFDDTGDQICEFGTDVADFAQESGKAIKKAAEAAAEAARKAAEAAAEATRKAAEAAAAAAKKAAEEAAAKAKKAAEDAAAAAKKAAEDAAKKVKNCAKKVLSFKKC